LKSHYELDATPYPMFGYFSTLQAMQVSDLWEATTCSNELDTNLKSHHLMFFLEWMVAQFVVQRLTC
jgi:hypothetical protein